MASEAQMAANRTNALHSTGPTSEAGKARSRLNAKRDDLTGQTITLADDDRAVFEKIQASHIADLNPQTGAERKLAQAIAWDTWRLDRLRAAEMSLFAMGAELTEGPAAGTPADVLTFRNEGKRLELMSLYENRMNRSLHRNMSALRELQAERRANYTRDREEEILLARFSEIKEVPHQTSSSPSPNGFVFSNEDIAGAAVRQRALEAAGSLLGTLAPWRKFGSTGTGSPDLFADMPEKTPRRPSAPKFTAFPPNPSPFAGISIRRNFARYRPGPGSTVFCLPAKLKTPHGNRKGLRARALRAPMGSVVGRIRYLSR